MLPNVLVVDDDLDILQFIELLINASEKCQCQLLTAMSGKEAIKIMQAHEIALIFLDYYLPDINGHELCRQIKQNPNTCHIPVHLFSASFSPYEEKGKEFIADGIMAKPFNNEEFIRRLNSILKPA